MLDQNALEKILGLEKKVITNPKEMAENLNITFFPYISKNISAEIKNFAEKLKATLLELGVKIIPYEETLTKLPFKKIVKRRFYALFNNIAKQAKQGKKVKDGISIIMLGEGETGNLPIDNIVSFKNSNVITIVDMPENINENSDFHSHFDTAMKLFAHHMTNIILAVNKENWLVYNFNASHPIYKIDDKNFKQNILISLIPKITAPIRPNKLSEFILHQEAFDPQDKFHKPVIDDIVNAGLLLEKTGLYPPGKTLDELPFRNDFYRWIGKIHLDHRNGMSYGFVAHQMPTFSPNEVWVMTLRSGVNKTKPNPHQDLVKIGLVNGKMILETPKGLKLKPDYKSSFDTKVILAHAVGNAIIAKRLKKTSPQNSFSKNLEKKGMALAHWHGYINKNFIPMGWHIHGQNNPHVACSTPQSAIFSLMGKIQAFEKAISNNEKFLGDIHIEPQHGTNITFNSLTDLAKFLNKSPEISKLGNEFLSHYH